MNDDTGDVALSSGGRGIGCECARGENGRDRESGA
jgi:hypothetical protein